ncbi:4-hydroxy-3-methylbut-2-enyl diphosphate reductase 1 [Apophysomyces sp. BC1015]|nr:4-hydroxy-3-methylbut-2-enyl diphosphate reductase 1 [Apophysomyces sp. BC1015]
MSIIDISEVKPGSHVTLHYRLSLDGGADIVNTFDDKPATLLLGAGQLAGPLEDILLGMKVGHHSTIRLMPEQAFGLRNPELIQKISLATLRENSMVGEDFSPGDLVEFNAPDGARYASVLKEVGQTSSAFCRSAMTAVTGYPSEILLAQPRGFCAGVGRAIEIVERALTLFGSPIYVRHEIVHNAYVVEDLRRKGAVFVESLDEVPNGATLIFSAHGVPKAVCASAVERGLRVFDATCPLVTKVHMEVAKLRADGFDIVMVGHRGHPEVEGTMGQASAGMHLVETVGDVAALQVADSDRIAYVTQTTLSIDDAMEVISALKARFPAIREPKKQDICYATQNRQDAVKFMAPQCDVVIVVGSPNSSNSNRLREVAEKRGVPAYRVDAPEQIDPAWLGGKQRVGVTAGASAPEALAQAVVERLRELGACHVRTLDGIQENVSFPLPKGLALPA